MNEAMMQSFWWVAACGALVLAAAAWYMITSRNLIRVLIGVELLTKAVTLLLAAGGWLGGRMALSQSLIITLIVVEVVVIAVAAGVVIGAYQHTNSLDTKGMQNLKG